MQRQEAKIYVPVCEVPPRCGCFLCCHRSLSQYSFQAEKLSPSSVRRIDGRGIFSGARGNEVLVSVSSDIVLGSGVVYLAVLEMVWLLMPVSTIANP